ncbi:peptidase-related [Anaeramoeba flamelloides]|uniref:Peptidase-related n=1 Tax=Anaeramoeba flamelloides TaxID=1746091 RepID=A0ABQ8X9N9_9EUKA|nr:peptidase-related [Anaeramoeba flamelloides]
MITLTKSLEKDYTIFVCSSYTTIKNSKVTFYLNGKQHKEKKGISILEACRSFDLYLPCLCSLTNGNQKKKKCDLCLVETNEQVSLVNACTTKIKEGMKIETNTKRATSKILQNWKRLVLLHPSLSSVEMFQGRKDMVSKTQQEKEQNFQQTIVQNKREKKSDEYYQQNSQSILDNYRTLIKNSPLTKLILEHKNQIHPIVKGKEFVSFDLLNLKRMAIDKMVDYVNNKIGQNYGICGFLEKRKIYPKNFIDIEGYRRNVHVGVDIFAPQGTPVYAPMDSTVYTSKYNGNLWNTFDGDYGPTIVLKHNIGSHTFYTLYGHLSLNSLNMKVGTTIKAGTKIGEIGDKNINGGWPTHTHIQVMSNNLIQDFEFQSKQKGDYPGVLSLKTLDMCLNNNSVYFYDPNLLISHHK